MHTAQNDFESIVNSNAHRFILFVFPTSQSFALVVFTAPHAAVSESY